MYKYVKIILSIACIFPFHPLFGQGKNHQFLVGYTTGLDSFVVSYRARLLFTPNSITEQPDNFKMPFDGTQANICDENGNLLMCTNGCWIADATGDTMLGGGGLNPGAFAVSWCGNGFGIPYEHADVFLPWPGDTTKYILFHQVEGDSLAATASKLYNTVVDMSLHGGLGAVTQKNNVVQYGDFNIGLNACKHANGRDWWLIMLKANTDSVLKILITPTGITSITTQSLSLPQHGEFAGQAQFSPDGSKYAFYHYTGTLGAFTNEIRLMDFDRCNGEFTNSRIYSFPDSVAGLGLSFSANSKYLYYSTFIKIYQFNTDTSNIAASVDTVATYDGYAYPGSLFQTTFWTMYLAANGKIYVSSGNTTIDLNYIDQPDSDGVSCNVMQHALRTPCYIFRSNVLHPNYYLGPVIGSVCDTLAHVGLQEHLDEVQNFSLMPNPVQDGIVKIAYLLPQNESGAFEVFDLNGKRVYQLPLPPWSTMQIIALPPLPGGVYECAIRSGMSKQVRKLVIVR